MAKNIWQSLLITQQGNIQLKDNKINFFVQQYEKFTILEEESINIGFARFNNITTSLKAVDEGFSSKNYGRKFLRALHLKWRAKVMTIEESKILSSLALDELISNLKVHEVVMEKDSKIYRGKKERVKSIALKAKKESSDDETSASGSNDEEYAMSVRNFKKFFRRKGLGFDNDKALTSETKTMSFVGSSVEKGTDGSTIKVHGSTLLGSVSHTYGEKATDHVFSPPMSSRSDFVIIRKKLIHNSIDESKKLPLKLSPKSGIDYEDSKPTKTMMSMEIKLTKDDEADSVDNSKYRGICIYSDAWGLDELGKTLEQIEPYNSRLPALNNIRNLIHRRTVHEKIDKEGNTIYKLPDQIKTNELFDHLRPCELVIRENVYSAIGYRDHTQAVIALMLYCLQNRQPFNLSYFIIRKMYFFRDRQDKVLPYGMILTRLFKNLKANMAQCSFDEHYKLVPRKMFSLKAKKTKRPPPKITRNVEKSKRTQLSTSSSTESPPLDNGDLPSTKLSPRSYHRALKDVQNMSKKQREIRRMFKILARALHKFASMLKKGCC
nr:DUF4219 domain-containing protein/UBN2 domain-containing protein [Tanacetum cinerariifolium]